MPSLDRFVNLMPDSSPAPVAASKGRVFMSRLASTVFLWVIITLALFLNLPWLLLTLIIAVGLLGTWEYFHLQPESRLARSFIQGALLLSLVYWAALFFITIPSHVEPPLWLDAALVWAAVAGTFLLVFRHELEGETTLRHLWNGVFGIVYTTLMWAFMARLLFFNGQSNGAYLLLMVMLVTKFGDMGAYLVGSLIGKHKMIPHISPGKTWQGFGGALLGSILGMVGIMLIFPQHMQPLTWGTALLLAPVLSIIGVIGDLAESVLKRCHQIKDSGKKLPGIGGILDLTDSLLFTAPAAYLYLKAIA